MNKEKLKESIKNIEEGLKTSRENLAAAQYHIDEGEIILAAFLRETKV